MYVFMYMYMYMCVCVRVYVCVCVYLCLCYFNLTVVGLKHRLRSRGQITVAEIIINYFILELIGC